MIPINPAQDQRWAPVLEQREEHLPAVRSFYYSIHIWIYRYKVSLANAVHHPHILVGKTVQINNTIAICVPLFEMYGFALV